MLSAFLTVTVKRYSRGMIYRLAIPIFLLVLLAGISFWGAPVDRMNVSITILLSVSALYIVVFDNIPMIGILTAFDQYVLIMFLILFICCIMHQIIIRFGTDTKVDKWPLRLLYIRLLEGVGRTCILPVIFTVFVGFFDSALNEKQLVVCSLLVAFWALLIVMRESKATRKAFTYGMANIAQKIESLANLSNFEILLFNKYTYNIWSISLTKHLKEINVQAEEIERLKQRKDELLYGGADSDDEDDSGHGNTSSLSKHSTGSAGGDRVAGSGLSSGVELRQMTVNPMNKVL
jgi:hypothetical protein